VQLLCLEPFNNIGELVWELIKPQCLRQPVWERLKERFKHQSTGIGIRVSFCDCCFDALPSHPELGCLDGKYHQT
jgi:hypothetical protein